MFYTDVPETVLDWHIHMLDCPSKAESDAVILSKISVVLSATTYHKDLRLVNRYEKILFHPLSCLAVLCTFPSSVLNWHDP
jgi:hypothetical protein